MYLGMDSPIHITNLNATGIKNIRRVMDYVTHNSIITLQCVESIHDLDSYWRNYRTICDENIDVCICVPDRYTVLRNETAIVGQFASIPEDVSGSDYELYREIAIDRKFYNKIAFVHLLDNMTGKQFCVFSWKSPPTYKDPKLSILYTDALINVIYTASEGLPFILCGDLYSYDINIPYKMLTCNIGLSRDVPVLNSNDILRDYDMPYAKFTAMAGCLRDVSNRRPSSCSKKRNNRRQFIFTTGHFELILNGIIFDDRDIIEYRKCDSHSVRHLPIYSVVYLD
jgi:hypothetical protein